MLLNKTIISSNGFLMYYSLSGNTKKSCAWALQSCLVECGKFASREYAQESNVEWSEAGGSAAVVTFTLRRPSTAHHALNLIAYFPY